MDSQSQLSHSHGQHYPTNPLTHTVEGEEEHHEKPSMFKRVKAKARKIKDSIANKSHSGHDQEEEEDETDEEEIVQDPEIHGAPMYESAAAKNYAMAPDVNIGTQATDPLAGNVCPGTFQTKVTDSSFPNAPKHDSGAPGDFATEPELKLGALKGTLGEKLRDNTDTNVPRAGHDDIKPEPGYVSAAIKNFDTPHDINTRPVKETFDEPILEEPRSPKRKHDIFSDSTKYQANAGVGSEGAGLFPTTTGSDDQFGAGVSPTTTGELGSRGDGVTPTITASHDKFGHEGAGVSPTTTGSHDQLGQQGAGATSILHSFDKMGIYDEPGHKKESTTTGSHDQFSPSPSPSPSRTPIPGFSSHKTDPLGENTPVPESFNPTSTTDEHRPQDMNVDQPATDQQTGYMGKIAAVGSGLAGTAVTAKNVVASKIGYGGNNENAPSSGFPRPAEIEQNRNVSGEPQEGQSTYTDKLYSATSAITGTAVSAKNAVGSKLGYGGSEATPATPVTNPPNPVTTEGSETARSGGPETAQSGGGVTGYGKQIASTVTEKLAPVYGTVAGAGTAVLSKIPGTGMGAQKETVGQEHTTSTPMETDRGVVGGTDKGVRMTGYIAEKLKPGEDDKALSEVISGALHKKPSTKGVDEEEKSNVGEMVKDAIHKRDDSDRENTNRPMGKVTESDEVAARLGSSESEKAGHVTNAGNESPSSTGVVDKMKGAFTSWFGKGGETNPSMAFNDQTQSHDTTGDALKSEKVSTEGERRLQESTN